MKIHFITNMWLMRKKIDEWNKCHHMEFFFEVYYFYIPYLNQFSHDCEEWMQDHFFLEWSIENWCYKLIKVPCPPYWAMEKKPMKVTKNFKTMVINLQFVGASKDLKGNRNRFVLFNANEQFDNGSSITSWWGWHNQII